MSYQELGDFSEQYRSIDTIDARQIRSGELQSIEIILTGGTKGIIRSEDFETAVGGWKIDAAGNAEFNNVTVRGIIEAGAGSDVDWSYISNVTIDNADITDLSFSKITAGTGTATLTMGTGGVIRTAASGERFEITGGTNASDLTWYNSSGGTVGYIGVDPSDHLWLKSTSNQIITEGSFIKLNANTGGSVQLGVNGTYGLIHSSGNTYIGTAQIGNTLDLNTYGPSITGQLKAANGSLGAPAYSFSGDTNTGMYWNGSGVIGFSNNGTLRLQVSTTTAVTGPLSVSGTSAQITSTGLIRSTLSATAGNNHFQCSNAGTGMSNSGGVLKFATSSTFRTQLGSAFWGPQTDNNMSTGASGARWSAVWAANGTIQTSDLREKNVLEDSPVPGLSFINQLDPFKYTWKRGDNDHVHWGVAAQQVQKLIGNEGPLRADNPDMLALNYAELVPALIVAVQELSAKLEAYEAR